MPKYTYQLQNGKTLTLEGDTQPTDEEVEQIAKENNVSLALAEIPAQSDPVAAAKSTLEATKPATTATDIPTTETAKPEEEPGMLAKAWKAISEPLTNIPSQFAESIAESIDRPSLDRSPREAYWRGLLAGMTEGAGDVASGFTSPLNIAATASGIGAARGVPGALTALRAASAPVLAHGASEVLSPESTMAERGFGLAEIAGGLAGMRAPKARTQMPEDLAVRAVPEELPLRQRLTEATQPVAEILPETIPEEIPYAKAAGAEDFNPASLEGLIQRSAPDEVTQLAKQVGLEEVPNLELVDEGRIPNASGESAASAEAISRQQGMKSKGEQFVVFDRAGNKRVLGGPEAVDYTAQKGETFGVETPRGFVKLDDLGGKVPAEVKNITPTRKEGPGFRGKLTEEGEVTPPKQAAEFGGGGGGEEPPRLPPGTKLGFEELDPDIPISERKTREYAQPGKLQQLYDLPRGLMSIDLPFMTSAAFRQASPLAWTGNWFKAWGKAAKSFGDEGAYNSIMQKVESNKYNTPKYEPRYSKEGKLTSYKELPSFAEESGLKLTDLGDISHREDFLRSQWAERLPGYGKYVRASNRAYTAFLNDLRMNKFEQMIDGLKAAGKNPETDLPLAQSVADFVNAATGRGKLEVGSVNLEQHAKFLTNALFSPRLIASRLKFLNPATYMQAPPGVRAEYVKGLLRTAATWWGLAGLAEMAGMALGRKDVSVSKDITNSDFGKVRIGNVRTDPGAGFQQYLVLLGRLGYGGITPSTGTPTEPKAFRPFGEGYKPETAGSTIARFGSYKVHPTLNAMVDLLNGVTGSAKFHVGDKILQLMTPLFIQDVMEASKQDPALGALMAPLGSIGFGGQTYAPGEDFNAPVFIPEEFDLTIGR